VEQGQAYRAEAAVKASGNLGESDVARRDNPQDRADRLDHDGVAMPITCPDCCDAKDSCSPRASPIFRDKKRYVPDKPCGWRASVSSVGGTPDRSAIERQPRSRRRPPL
jgi:hypothetical protein